MKKFLSILLTLLMLFGCAACVSAETRVLLPAETPDYTLIAHRGFSALAPENTLAAFRLAGESGFYGCECDIWPTADGEWVIMHDETVNRMTDGTGKITDYTFDALQQLHIDAGNQITQYPNEKIPTLIQYLDICTQYQMLPVIELKGGTEAQIRALGAMLLSRADADAYCIISFGRELLLWMREVMPETKMLLLVSNVSEADVTFCVQNQLDGIDFNFAKTKEAMIDSAHAADLECVAWTVNAVKDAEQLYSLGVTCFTTNGLSESKPNQPESRPTFWARLRAFFQKIFDFFRTLF